MHAATLGRDDPPNRITQCAHLEHLLLVRKVLEGAGLDDSCRDRVDPDPARRELDREVANERFERGLGRADEREAGRG